MPKVPITIEWSGKKRDCILHSVSGAGSVSHNYWGLMLNNYHKGYLSFSKENGWQFYTQERGYPEWAQYMGGVIEKALPDVEYLTFLELGWQAEGIAFKKLFGFNYEGRYSTGYFLVYQLDQSRYYARLMEWKALDETPKPGNIEFRKVDERLVTDRPEWEDIVRQVGEKLNTEGHAF